jgi:hypothetical protein
MAFLEKIEVIDLSSENEKHVFFGQGLDRDHFARD